MTKRVRLTLQAENDILDIWEYIAADNVDAADALVDRFTQIFDKLTHNPDMGIKQDRYRHGLRCFPIGNYIIFYRVTDDRIEIYRVLHGARQLEDLL